MEKWVLWLTLLTLLCTVLQILPVILVPITGPNSHVYLSHYQNFSFGVFGICYLSTNNCSAPAIGYPRINDSFYELFDSEFQVAELPLSVTSVILKLLVVHVVAFGVSAVQLLLLVALIVFQETEVRMAPSEAEEPIVDHPGQRRKRNKVKTRDYTPFMDWILVFSLVSFLLTLLAFLADILLFISNLSYVGWIQLFPIMSLAIISLMLCFMKRLISTRKFLEDDHVYYYDDMRMRRNSLDWDSDRGSDDGFTYNVGELPLRRVLVHSNPLSVDSREQVSQQPLD